MEQKNKTVSWASEFIRTLAKGGGIFAVLLFVIVFITIAILTGGCVTWLLWNTIAHFFALPALTYGQSVAVFVFLRIVTYNS